MAGSPQLKSRPALRLLAVLLVAAAGAALLVDSMPASWSTGQAGRASGGLLQPRLVQRLPSNAVPIRYGEDYRLARRRLLSQGWRPQQRPAEPGCLLLPGDRRCTLYPELASCALTGLGLCRFDWLSPGGEPFAVITRQGSADGRPGVIERWFLSR